MLAISMPTLRLFELVAELDRARGVVAKRLADPCALRINELAWSWLFRARTPHPRQSR